MVRSVDRQIVITGYQTIVKSNTKIKFTSSTYTDLVSFSSGFILSNSAWYTACADRNSRLL